MIVDFHAVRGNQPRQGKNWTLDRLTHWADLAGVDRLVVEAVEARWRADDAPYAQLLADCRTSRGRFWPAATIGLESDRRSVEIARGARGRGFACVVLHGPVCEGSRVLREVLDALARAPVPVYRELPYPEMDLWARIAEQHPRIPFVFAPSSFQALELNHRLIDVPNVYLSMARTLYAVGQLEMACARMGARRVLYASDMPHQHPARPLGVIWDADISDEDREWVLGRSARTLLAECGVDVGPAVATRPRPSLPCRIIDTHGHIGSDFRRPDFDDSVEGLLRFLDRGGGDRIYVSDTEAIWGDVAAGNRRTLAAMTQYPEKIGGYVVVNPNMGEECLREVRWAHARGFVGLKPYGTFVDRFTDRVMDPVWQIAEELGMPVLCHCAAADIRSVAERHPRVKILAAHMSFAYREKAEIARDFPNVVLEISGAGAGVEDVADAVAVAGAGKIVFGSDLNCHALGFTLAPLLCSGLPEDALRAILRENALLFLCRQ